MFNFVRLSDGGPAESRTGLKSEVEIVSEIGSRLLSGGPIDFRVMRNHDEIRSVIGRVVPGYSQMQNIGTTRKEFYVEGRIRHEPRFSFPDGRARFQVVNTPDGSLADSELRLMTIRSEGQFNTVVYEEYDRYRNQSSRDVILMNPEDVARLGLSAGARITVSSATGQLENIRVVPYNIALRCVAMYYPEANALVPPVTDRKSGTPPYKHVRVQIRPSVM
jgi:anaerobic selenocysteine-containing dehydrogenase